MDHDNRIAHEGYEQWRFTTPPNQQSERAAWVAGWRAAHTAPSAEVNGGEWYHDGQYIRNHRRQVALAHCQDEEIAEQIVNDHNRLVLSGQAGGGEALEAATACADLLVRVVRPMYSGPSGDQGLNDPLYGECLRAINRYRQSRNALAVPAEVVEPAPEPIPPPERCAYRYPGSAGQCLNNAVPGWPGCRNHPRFS